MGLMAAPAAMGLAPVAASVLQSPQYCTIVGVILVAQRGVDFSRPSDNCISPYVSVLNSILLKASRVETSSFTEP